MSDKKKKIFTPKEQTTSKRPIILKSDRESTRDQVKEKPDKDKEKDKPQQPTIILKTREQSTPKDDRPHSPKSLKMPMSEGDLVHPKIAHNEHKEKKEHKSCPLKLMTEPVKLIDENLEFNNAGLEFLSDASTNYLVVGVVGLQGVGKSMVMNLITQDTFDHNLCSYILNSHEPNKEGASEATDIVGIANLMDTLELSEPVKDYTGVDFKFKLQNIDQIEKGTHCTKGVDMYATSDRVIVLDCQAVGASRGEDPRGAPTDCLQLTSFLMSVCHIIVAVQDWFTDYNFVRYIQTAEMLTPSLTASSSAPAQDASESTSSGEVHPHLLLLHNRCQLEDFTPEFVKIMQDLYRKAFQKSNVQLDSGMYMYSDCNRNGMDIDQASKGYSVAECGEPLNLFLLPEIYEDYDNREIYRGHPPFEKLARRLRWMIFGVKRHHITNVPNLSEKGWFQFCAKAWETIRMCTFFLEYERFLP